MVFKGRLIRFGFCQINVVEIYIGAMLEFHPNFPPIFLHSAAMSSTILSND